MLRPTVSRPVCLGIKHPSGAYDQIFSTVRQLRVCCCGVLSLKRGRICRLQLLLVLASAVILGSESRGTRDHILLSPIRVSSLLGSVGLFITPLHGPSIKHRFQQYLYCCMRIRCSRNVLPSRFLAAAIYSCLLRI
jgi:hypothetical protein